MLVPLELPQGLYKQGTVYEAKNRWYDAQLVRFLEDTIRPIGGWNRLSESLQASLYAQDLFTADPGNISLDYTTSGYISDLEFAGWDVEDPSSAQLQPDPSEYLAFPSDPTPSFGFRSRDAIEQSDFAAFMDVKWTGDPSTAPSALGMYVRTNDTYITTAGAEGWLFQVDVDPGSGGGSVSLDTMTYAGPGWIDVNDHTADTGQTWDADTGEMLVDSNYEGGVLRPNTGTSQGRLAMQDSGGVAFSEADEVYVDMYHATGHVGGGANQSLYFMSAAGKGSLDYFRLNLYYLNSTNCLFEMYARNTAGAQYASTQVGNYTVDWQGEWRRVGVTIVAANKFIVWREDYGGGNRVEMGEWNPTYNADLDFLDDATYGYMGAFTQTTQAVTGQLPSWKNFTKTAGVQEFLIRDTYTRGAGTQTADTWTADTGEVYSAADDFDVSGDIDTGVLIQNTLSGGALYAYQTGPAGGEVCLEGYEVYCDLYHATGHDGVDHNQGFFFMKDWLSAPQAFYRFNVEYTGDSADCQMHREISALRQSATGLGTVSHPQDSWLRYGVTVISAHSYQLWWEPKGGGTRTLLDIWNPTPQESYYDFLNNNNYRWMGAWSQATSFVTGQYPAWDNLTMQNPDWQPTNAGYFTIHASRVVDGSPYEIGETVSVEFPWVTAQYDYSDGFRFGVDIEGSEAKAWYEGFNSTTTRTYLDWDGQAVDTPLDLTTDAGGSTDDYDDAGHQYSGIFRGPYEDTAGTRVYQYAYQQLDFSGPFVLDGVPRGAIGWEKGARGYLSFGTTEKLYSYSIGYLYDITPAGFVLGAEDSTTDDEASGRYGRGAYGQLTYGVGQQGITEQYDADIWHLDTFGGWLLGTMVPTDDEFIYVWKPEDGGETPAEAITVANGYTEQPPSPSRGLVVTPDRFTVSLGADGDSRLVAWSDRETIDVWTPTLDNEAGSFALEGSGRIMRGMRGRGETCIWTDTDLWVMTYVAGAFVHSFEKRGTNCGLIAPLAVAGIDSGFCWWSQRGFYLYDGYAKPLECPVQDAVFSDLDELQRVKINSVVNQLFGEVWWFYPSIDQDPGECDHYVIWNYRENHWTLGTLARTCGVEASASTKNLLMLSPNGYAYSHEQGWEHTDIQGDPITPYIESGPVEFGDGERVFNALQFIPDEKNLGDVTGYFYTSYFPMEDEVLHGPYTMAVEQDVRLTARQMRVRLEQNVAGDWRVGTFRFESEPGGRR